MRFEQTVASGSSSEIELLLRSARVAIGSEDTRSVQELVSADVDWELLIHTAGRLGVLPLVCRTVLQCDSVPPLVRKQLESFFHTNARRNLLQTGELLQILQVLEMHGVPAIPLKGPTLTALAYGDLALREFSDLDLLLRYGDVPKATELLAARQYRLRDPGTSAELGQKMLSEHRHHVELLHKDTKVVVELHWHLMQERYFFTPDLDGMWNRRVQRLLAGSPVNSLDTEDLVLFLCVHGWKHYWHRLSWIADLAGVIRNTHIDWTVLWQRASDSSARQRVLLGLGLVDRLFGTPLPAATTAKIRTDRVLGNLIVESERMLFSQEVPAQFLGPFGVYRYANWSSDGISHRAKILLTFARKNSKLNANDLAWIKLPRPVSVIHYFLKPIRLVLRAIARARYK